MRKYLVFSVLFLTLAAGIAHAASALQFGLNMGGMSPDSDAVVKRRFGPNFTTNGTASWVGDNGLELRGLVGIYGDVSDNPEDAGKNFRIDMTQLKASLIYNFATSGMVRPYVGAGAGAAFYTVKDDEFGDLESGTRLGPHIVVGTKVMLSDTVYGAIEYEKQFLPALFFTNSNNFNTSSLTLGLGIQLPIGQPNRPRSESVTRPSPASVVPTAPYPYSQREEEMLAKIQQLRTEVSEMKTERTSLQGDVDAFYRTTTYNERSAAFRTKLQAIKFTEGKIAALDRQIQTASSELSFLETTWQNEHPQRQVVEKEIIYLDNHYHSSPWGLRRSHGYLTYGSGSYRHRYYSRQVVNINTDVQTQPSKSPAEIQKEKAEYLEKKKAHILEMKNRN